MKLDKEFIEKVYVNFNNIKEVFILNGLCY